MFIDNINLIKLGHNNEVYQAGSILPVLSAHQLLESGRYHAVIRQLQDLVSMPTEHFETLYQGLINRFVEFVQVLPVGFTTPLGGLLNDGLARGLLACHEYYQANGRESTSVRAYAVFSAGLLRDVSHVVINQCVVMSDEQGDAMGIWYPLQGSMVGCAEYYRMTPISTALMRLDVTLRHLLARQLMPEAGYQWIAKDYHLLADWFDAVSGDDSSGGVLASTLSLVKLKDVQSLSCSLVKVVAEQRSPDNTRHGQAFYEWLTTALSRGDLSVNTADSGVHVVEEGVFLEKPKVFKEFLDTYNEKISIGVVYAQFGNLMGIPKKGGADLMNAQYFSEYGDGREVVAKTFASPIASHQHSLRDGMVLADPARIFLNARIPSATPLLRAMQQPNTAMGACVEKHPFTARDETRPERPSGPKDRH